MSQSDQFDNYNNENSGTDTISDTYTAESSEDIYNTPDISASTLNSDAQDVSASPMNSDVQDDSASTMNNDTPAEEPAMEEDPEDNPYGESADSNAYYNNLYRNDPYAGQNAQNGNPYISNSYGNTPYVGQTTQNNNSYHNNSYGNTPYTGQTAQGNNIYYSDPYANNPYVGQNAQNNNQYGGQNTQNNDPYSNNAYGNNQYNNNQYGNNQYSNGQYGNNQYSNNQYGNNQYNNNQYGNPPYGNEQYGPYAVPSKKNNTGLIIGIVVAVIVLFLIAFGALTYKVVSLYSEERDNNRHNAREEYNFDDDDWEKDRNHRDDDDWYHDYDDDYDDDWYHDYDDDWYHDYDNDYNYDDDEYYTLHDDIKSDLSYSVDFEFYKYDTDYDTVNIEVYYPVIRNSSREGFDIPNLDKINSTIYSEVDFLVDYFEEEYGDYFDEDDDYFNARSEAYVTYMDEEKLSIVFSEVVYSGYFNEGFLYCINIDMENGIILDNESMLNVDDDFSVEFRQKSDIQNGEISYLTRMSDQEITDYFNSSDIIVFYTPQGMEIGFNFDGGWVTVTYQDYEQYLKVF